MLEQYKVRREEREALERKVEKEMRKWKQKFVDGQLKLAEQAENIRLQLQQEAAEKAGRVKRQNVKGQNATEARSDARNVGGRGGHGRKGKNRGGRNGGRGGNRNDAAIMKAKDTRRNKAKKTKKVRFVGDTHVDDGELLRCQMIGAAQRVDCAAQNVAHRRRRCRCLVICACAEYIDVVALCGGDERRLFREQNGVVVQCSTKKKIGTQSGSRRTKKVTAVLPDSAARTRKEEREWMERPMEMNEQVQRMKEQMKVRYRR